MRNKWISDEIQETNENKATFGKLKFQLKKTCT